MTDQAKLKSIVVNLNNISFYLQNYKNTIYEIEDRAKYDFYKSYQETFTELAKKLKSIQILHDETNEKIESCLDNLEEILENE